MGRTPTSHAGQTRARLCTDDKPCHSSSGYCRQPHQETYQNSNRRLGRLSPTCRDSSRSHADQSANQNTFKSANQSPFSKSCSKQRLINHPITDWITNQITNQITDQLPGPPTDPLTDDYSFSSRLDGRILRSVSEANASCKWQPDIVRMVRHAQRVQFPELDRIRSVRLLGCHLNRPAKSCDI